MIPNKLKVVDLGSPLDVTVYSNQKIRTFNNNEKTISSDNR